MRLRPYHKTSLCGNLKCLGSISSMALHYPNTIAKVAHFFNDRLNNMPIHTLFILQPDYSNAETVLKHLDDVYTESDAVLLMQDSALFLHHPSLLNIKHLYLLADDAQHFNIPTPLLDNIKIISHAEWATYLAQSEKVITLK